MLPVLDTYEIHRQDKQFSSGSWGERSLVRGSGRLGNGFGGSLIVGHVEGYAVAGHWIVGSTSHGYFMFNARGSDPNARIFSTRQEWQAALVTAGIPRDIQIVDPDVAAETVSDQILHPWDYHFMRGRFGLSDGAWAVLVQLTGLAAAFAIGAIPWFRSHWVRWAVGIAWFVTIVSHGLMTGGGPELFLGLFVYPLVTVPAAFISSGIRDLVEYIVAICRDRQPDNALE